LQKNTSLRCDRRKTLASPEGEGDREAVEGVYLR
jgi:hypothetical protein